MDQLRDFLNAVRTHHLASGHFRGLLWLLVGRRISLSDGTLVSAGMTWRALAAALKKYRWDREQVRELGLEPSDLPPRDREKYWYVAISRASLNSPEAIKSAETIIGQLVALGYVVGATLEAPLSNPPVEDSGS